MKRIILMLSLITLCSAINAAKKKNSTRVWGPTGIYGSLSKGKITVSAIEPKSPADGKLQVGDIIVGIGNYKFPVRDKDLRKKVALEIIQSESTGSLKILLSNRSIVLSIDKIGEYSDSAPSNCKKSDYIIRRASEYIMGSKARGQKKQKSQQSKLIKKDNQHGKLDIGLIALLSTGEAKCIEYVKEVIHKSDWASPELKLNFTQMYGSWTWGYKNILLSEYYLLTGDKYVLPAIKEYSLNLARGCDAGGLWGHKMALKTPSGEYHGRLVGYAQMNQTSLHITISLLLAKKCGIIDDEIEKAIALSMKYYESHIGKGTFPYGVHGPQSSSYNNNGMSGSAAVLMALNKNSIGADFFQNYLLLLIIPLKPVIQVIILINCGPL